MIGSVLQGAGNFLDLPGSMVRDVVAFQNPFDQVLTPFSGNNRTSGRDLLRRYGMASDKDTWGNYLGGMAAETLLDPTNLVGGGLLKNALNRYAALKQIGKSTTAGFTPFQVKSLTGVSPKEFSASSLAVPAEQWQQSLSPSEFMAFNAWKGNSADAINSVKRGVPSQSMLSSYRNDPVMYPVPDERMAEIAPEMGGNLRAMMEGVSNDKIKQANLNLAGQLEAAQNIGDVRGALGRADFNRSNYPEIAADQVIPGLNPYATKQTGGGFARKVVNPENKEVVRNALFNANQMDAGIAKNATTEPLMAYRLHEFPDGAALPPDVLSDRGFTAHSKYNSPEYSLYGRAVGDAGQRVPGRKAYAMDTVIPEGTPLADLSAEINKFRESEILPQSGREYDILARKPLNDDITNVLAEMRNPNESYLRRWARRPKSLPQALSMVAAYNALARGWEDGR